jgi:hypothetical protein
MPTVRMLTGMAGPFGTWTTGDPYTCDEAEAGRLIAAGYAEPWPEDPVPTREETAMAPGAPERAMKPRAKARG